MAAIHIQRIKSALTKLFESHIMMSDYDGKPDTERMMAFLSRALAAYTLTLLCETDDSTAAASVVDGFDDNGIDLVHFDADNNVLYLGQAKWIESGNRSISQADCNKLLNGCRDLVNLRLGRFNDHVRTRAAQLQSAVYSTDVRIVLFFSYSGTQPLSSHVSQDVSQFLKEMNDPTEVFSLGSFNQASIYNSIAAHAQRHSINLEIMLHDWGHIEEPHPAYYGQVDAACIAQWWKEHGRSLFARNIRSFKGSTDVNESIAATLRDDPEHFWYFNNGITILCRRIAKQLIGGPTRDSGVFACQGVNVVNGAQTVGIIGTTSESLGRLLEQSKVLVRLISLETCPEGFDKTLTRATNTQNRIGSRDFAALDPNQQRLASEFLLDGRQYAFKSGDAEPREDCGCSIVDATVALACNADIALAVQAKREIGRLWEDIEKEPYTTLFNEQTNATDVWKAVEILRIVDRRLKELAKQDRPRADLIAIHGNRLVLHRVFRHSEVRGFKASSADLHAIKAVAGTAADSVFARTADYLEGQYPNAYLASFFKNLNRCKELNDHLASAASTQQVADTQSSPTGKAGRQRLLFDDQSAVQCQNNNEENEL